MQGHVSQEEDMRRGPWTLEEDNKLSRYISKHGEGRWNVLAKCAGLKRTGKSCRLRWLNYLKPDIKRGNLTPQEQFLILELHSKLGNRWSKIVQHLPGRTDNEIKNYWRTRVQRQARQLNMESSSKRFLEAIRCFWAPRLLHNMNQSKSSDTSMNFPNHISPDPYSDHYTPPCHLQPIQQQQEQQHMYSFKDCSSHVLGFESFDGTMYNEAPILSDGFDMDGLETMNQAPTGGGAMRCGDTSAMESQVAEPDWLINNVGDDLWNMSDEMWRLDI